MSDSDQTPSLPAVPDDSPLAPGGPAPDGLPAGLSAATRAVHAGRPAHVPDAPLNEPLTMASVYVATGDREYGRYGNPTWQAFEAALGDLEGGDALAFSSGLAAVSCVLDLVGQDALVLAPDAAYQGTLGQLADLEMRGRLRSRLVDVSDTEAVLAALDDDVALVWIESPTNPNLDVADVEAICAAAHEVGAYVVVDNTFATPLLQQPLDQGADIVVHSATKYLAGHSDALLGALVTRDEQLRGVLKGRRDLLGAVPGTLEAWLALRGMRTLHLRLERACANAAELAGRLARHDAVGRVRYPGWGAMVSIELGGGALAADLLPRKTRLWVHATSLGGVESTLERRRRWAGEPRTVSDALVRLSVGVEDVEDLWADLSSALDDLVG
ncbi:aminotransferase class I/II-fold pyridoxal phosphate-dependent enzyme [Nocardioides sp. GY 10127]|uniref:trans-sulfuration enzyme family protein n=1 Tax=Nocardioides sp. GY 10127 TaxID=2569762 RepID=UPI0010A820FB|nr:aminotransferase class I/II-fold pyridoxal phosphate-dependent enzyme [Nocardioides sp. GY 10127]TIC80818.1 aminotransferase class I/II-fold pyridoxal phosphate-dependent enzyme [Nocardioides sp. GY 10127]